MAAELFGRTAQRRVEYWTFGLGATAALAAAAAWGWAQAVAIGLGAALSWVNYRWLKQMVRAMAVAAIATEESSQARVPRKIYAKFIGRYALLVVALFAILWRFGPLAVPFLCGLFAVVAAVIVEMLHELARAWKQTRSG